MASEPTQYVFAFGERTDGDASMRNLLGGKGANLAEMARIGLPVPPGFTISTDVCAWHYERDGDYPPGFAEAVREQMAVLERIQGKRFGDPGDPLLVSVRSGARESMPGMMDTILNLGLNDETVQGLASTTGDARFAEDCYRRFIHMFAGIVLGVGPESESAPDPFEEMLDALKRDAGVDEDADLDARLLARLVAGYKDIVAARLGTPFPEDVDEQLWGAIGAVFRSWTNERAVIYRQRYGIPRSWGTAVNVQAMVFGNRRGNSATGVAFTRDPAHGEKTLYGEYLLNAQGEDVVAGVRTPLPIVELGTEMPRIYRELESVRDTLEGHFHDMQDFEFTIDDERLYLLQTRSGKRTGLAAVRIAVEMHAEGLLDEATALMRITADSIDSLLAPTFETRALDSASPIARGLPAGPGAASGRIVFTPEDADRLANEGERLILCRTKTSPEDLKGMLAAEGILTTRGGVSSHAALVARQLGKVCVCGASDIVIDYAEGTLTTAGRVLRAGDAISLDGTTGAVYAGAIATSPSEVRRVLAGDMNPEDSPWYRLYQTVMAWADAQRRVAVRANADTPAMARDAIRYGAEGIGLCRTEHMFFEADRIDAMRQMILAADEAERRTALAELLPYQRDDFADLFVAMAGRPVTIRLLDPPLHEFLPAEPEVRRALAAKLRVPVSLVEERVRNLTEVNPMLGWRGCRLGILYPEITETQTRAIFEAATAAKGGGTPVRPEIMVPLVGFREELADQVAIIRRVAAEVAQRTGTKVDYQVGTMIEVPRAALTADEIAREAEFFSFGTNDLTQMTLGLSRDDMGGFFDRYVEKEIYPANPFARIDESGVGRLITEAVRLGRSTRQDLKIGICGEHGGDPASIAFCENAGLDYVSCSPLRVPGARVAAAQATLANRPTMWTAH
ncbi:MAG: pyruvate, phosphate dikinase [Gammaproteobacteria bacterium]|nr:pyruvate, phosphate dikinase [Gammaproteobacteria bacterium]